MYLDLTSKPRERLEALAIALGVLGSLIGFATVIAVGFAS